MITLSKIGLTLIAIFFGEFIIVRLNDAQGINGGSGLMEVIFAFGIYMVLSAIWKWKSFRYKSARSSDGQSRL